MGSFGHNLLFVLDDGCLRGRGADGNEDGNSIFDGNFDDGGEGKGYSEVVGSAVYDGDDGDRCLGGIGNWRVSLER